MLLLLCRRLWLLGLLSRVEANDRTIGCTFHSEWCRTTKNHTRDPSCRRFHSQPSQIAENSTRPKTGRCPQMFAFGEVSMNRLPRAVTEARIREVHRYFIRGVGSVEAAEALSRDGRFGTVSARQVRRDMAAFQEELHRMVQANDLYSLKRAFKELEEVQAAAWVQYMKPPPRLVDKRGNVIVKDDRLLKLRALDRILAVTVERCRLSGLFSPKV